jgi:RNA polymerase sigma-70 factor (ECF subfamily)
MKNRNTDQLYERLKKGDESALTEVYDTYKSEFLNFFKKYNIDKDSVLDIYQESVIVVYQKIMLENFELTSSSLKTYIYGIGKNKVYDFFKRKAIYTDDLQHLKSKDEFTIEEEPNLYVQNLAKNIKLISDSCQRILKLFYYRGLTIKDIVQHTDYKDENTVKAHKSRCLKKLKDLCNA